MAQNFASRRLADSFSLTFFLVLICFTSFRLCVPGDIGCPEGLTFGSITCGMVKLSAISPERSSRAMEDFHAG